MSINKTPNDIAGKVEVTGASIVKRLRRIAQPPGRKGTWLRLLSDRQLTEIFHRLRRGQTPAHIMRIVRNEWGIMEKSSNKSMRRALAKFRDQAIGQINVEMVDPNKPPEDKKVIRKLKDKIKDKLDGMGRLRWLIEIQSERIELYRSTEKKTNVPLKSTDRSVKILGELLNQYVCRCMELGLLDAPPSEFNLNVKHRFDGLMKHTVGDGGVAMIEATSTFLAEAEKSALTMEIGDDGRYILKGNEDGGDVTDSQS